MLAPLVYGYSALVLQVLGTSRHRHLDAGGGQRVAAISEFAPQAAG